MTGPLSDDDQAAFEAWQSEPIVSRGYQAPAGVLLPDLPAGFTTIYDAAIRLTGHDSRVPVHSKAGEQAVTREQLMDYLRTIDGPDRGIADLFNEMRARLEEGTLLAARTAFLEDGRTADPFRTLISEHDARDIFRDRGQPAAAAAQPGPPAMKKRRHSGLDYREADRPLVEQGLEGIQSGTYRNATDAARALAARAEGGGAPSSKTVRLASQIKHRLEQGTDG